MPITKFTFQNPDLNIHNQVYLFLSELSEVIKITSRKSPNSSSFLLRNSLRELIHIQSRVIQKKIHIKKNVSIVLGEYLTGFLFWRENQLLFKDIRKGISRGEDPRLSLFTSHCLRQIGLLLFFS